MAIARKTCKLFGIEFEAPITLDEVPKSTGDRGNGKAYYVVTHSVDGFRVHGCGDHGRNATRLHVATGMAHWNEKSADKHIEALKAFNRHAITHAA